MHREAPEQPAAHGRAMVLGVDAAVQGWIGVGLSAGGTYVGAWFDPSLEGLIEQVAGTPYALTVVAVDMPIGLPIQGGRRADALARERLKRFASTVFSSPTRAMINAETYDLAAVAHREATGKGLTKQTWALQKKLIEVDRWVRTPHPFKIVEVHPEVSFVAMNGPAPAARKRSWRGAAERRALLEGEGIALPLNLGEAGLAGEDDVLDAAAAACTARRVLDGSARPIPDPPEQHDGPQSAIWA